MAFTHHDFQYTAQGAGPTTTVTLAAIATTAGDLIVFGLKWQTANTAITSITDTIGNSYTSGTLLDNPSGDLHGQMFYCLSSIGTNAANIIIVTFTTATAWQRARCWTKSYASTAVVDVEVPGIAKASGDAPALDPESGPFSTATTTDLVVAFLAGYGNITYSSPLVNAIAATARGANGSDTYDWDLVTTAAISSGTVTVHQNANQRWCVLGLAFKESSSTLWAQSVM